MIRKATRTDLDPIMKITKACAAHMIAQNIFQWNDHYPNSKAFEHDIEREELFVLEKDSEVQGCIVISTLMDEEYKPISWLTPNNNNIYVHRLAIHPKNQGRGFAQKLMNFAESMAKQNSAVSIRLDTFSQNKRNQKFYELRGYKRLDPVYFPKQSEHPFYCYELVF